MTEAAPKIVFIDDDRFIRESTTQSLQMEGFEVLVFDNASSALAEIVVDEIAAIVCDIMMPGLSGLDLLKRMQDIDVDLPVILITGQGDIAMAVQAMRDGAQDFLEKPFSTENLIEIIRKAVEKRQLVYENRNLRLELALQNAPGLQIIGKSANVQQLRSHIAKLADTAADILIHGETGTGKDLVARRLHEAGVRCDHPFVVINCGALPENIIESELFGHASGAFTGATKKRIGKFQFANGGTVFLDEIESMPLDLQVKLLRVLQERVVEPLGSNQQIEIDVRVIAATKIDLLEASRRGLFREDLYYRLNVINLKIPALRERVEDIPLLFHHFVLVAASRHQCEAPILPPAHLQKLIMDEWPGNVRELKNTAERFVLMGTEFDSPIEPSLTDSMAFSLHERVEWFEKNLIEQGLAENEGSINATLATLITPRKTLYDKMRKYGIDKDKFK